MRRILAAAALSVLPLFAACSRRAPESRITSVEARIDGLTCPTCVPPLRNSLKRQYVKSAVDVSDETDTATVRFAPGEDFSASEFRGAVERVRMRVVSLHLQACGTVRTSNGDKWLTAGANRFLVHSDRDVPVDTPVCADGTLDTSTEPATFVVSKLRILNP